ncbi:MAG TPA: DUF4424 domain-containing protein [Deltaproteobacteria bacterium]|nr:DUF4424 domain-containing protein [Deltaproteobacteria bacterium]
MIKILIQAIAILVILCFSPISFANDSAAGIAATGIYLKEEKNISIEKEDLYISENKIEVSYIFKNHSNNDIITEIVFPIPDYKFDLSDMTVEPMYDDFIVEINGKRIKHKEEIRAFVNKIDHTILLENMGISIKDFGKIAEFTRYNPKRDKGQIPELFFKKLSKVQQQLLIKNNLVINDNNFLWPNWKVSRKYYWTQTFPAKGTVTVRHSYRPYMGYALFSSKNEIPQNACIDGKADLWLKKRPNISNYTYVDYILVTANNWKKPIRSFRLVIESKDDGKHISTCYPKLTKKTSSRFEASLTNFVPKQDIRIYFIEY